MHVIQPIRLAAPLQVVPQLELRMLVRRLRRRMSCEAPLEPWRSHIAHDLLTYKCRPESKQACAGSCARPVLLLSFRITAGVS